MKCDSIKFLPWIRKGYDNLDKSNTFDIAVEYAMKTIPTFPRVSIGPGFPTLPGFKSYLMFPGLVPPDFDGGSLTWKNPSQVGPYYGTYVMRKWVLYAPVVHHVKNSIKSKWILPKSVGVMKRQFSNAEEIFRQISGQQFNLGGVRCEMKICCADLDHAFNIGE
jgi:hypothetical protein